MATNCRVTLGLSEHGTRLQRGSAPSSCRTPTTSSQVGCSSCSNNKQRARAVIAQGSHAAGRSTSRRAAAPAVAAAALRNTYTPPSTDIAEDSYDYEGASAAPMHALPGSRIELSESLEESEQPLYGGTFDGTHYDSQNWEEMTSLLSFDGEEHKYVMRHMPGAGMRVEDMFASFDGDDFEAVMTAAVRSSEPPAAAAASAAAAKPAPSSGINSSLDSSDEPEDLYLAVSRRRAAAMAAEAANKQSPKPRRRKAPLGSQASDAWMFHMPVNSQGAAQLQSLSLEQQYEAAQRALLPPLEPAAAADAARQQAAGVGAAGAAVAAANVAAQQPQEVVVVVVQRPDAGDRPVTPAPHAAHAQPAGEPHQLLFSKLNSSGSTSSRIGAAGLLSEAAAVAQARPAASASEGMLGIAGVGAVTVATQQRQHGEMRNSSSRVLSAAPMLLAPLVAATAEMAGAASAGVPVGVVNAGEAAAEEAEARARLPALPSSDDEEYEQELLGFAARVMGGSSSSKAGDSSRAASASKAGLVTGDVYNEGLTNGGFDYVKARQPAGRAALRRALSKLKCSSMVLGDRPGGS